jgi:hypothetical protein
MNGIPYPQLTSLAGDAPRLGAGSFTFISIFKVLLLLNNNHKKSD